MLIVVLALVVLQSSFFQTSNAVSDVQLKQCKASAQQAAACYDQVTFFNGSKTFDMLGYSANPLLCNCSDYNPDAFTVSVGTAGLTEIGFSSSSVSTSPVLFSSLSFEDVTATADSSPTTTYAFSVPLPPGKYQFFLVSADHSVTPLEVQTITTASDGRLVYSWDSLPAGSHVKVNPLTKISEEQKNAAKSEKDQSPSASELEKQAGANSQSKDVKPNWSLKLLSPKDGKLRAIYTYTPPEDYADSFSMTVPIAAARIAKVHPLSSIIVANAENPEASDISWDRVTLMAGVPMRLIIEFKPDAQGAATLSSEADVAIGKIKDKNLAKTKGKGATSCIAVEKACIPSGVIGGSCCPDSSCELNGLGFSCKTKTTANPTASVNPSENANPSLNCVASGSGCGILPGSKACCGGGSCQLDGLATVCKGGIPSPSATPLPSCESAGGVCQNPVPQPTCAPGVENCPKVNPCTGGVAVEKIEASCSVTGAICCKVGGSNGFDLDNLNIIESEPWTFEEIKEDKPTPTPSPTPEPEVANLEAEAAPLACANADEELQDGQACCAGLSAVAQDFLLATSAQVCQKPENAKSDTSPQSERPFASADSTSSASSISLSKTLVNVDSLITQSGGSGFGIPENALVQDTSGNLFLASQQPVYLEGATNRKLGGGTYLLDQFYKATSFAYSGDREKSCSFLKTQQLPDQSTIDSTPFIIQRDPKKVCSQSTPDWLNEQKLSEGVITSWAPDDDLFYYKAQVSEASGSVYCKNEKISNHAIKNECTITYSVVPENFGASAAVHVKKSGICSGGFPKAVSFASEPIITGDTMEFKIGGSATIYCPRNKGSEPYSFKVGGCTVYYEFIPTIVSESVDYLERTTEFHGLAPAPSEGAYAFYSNYEVKKQLIAQPLDNLGRYQPQKLIVTNKSEFHVVRLSKDLTKTRDRIIATDAPADLAHALRFLHSQGGKYYFSDSKKLYSYHEKGNDFTDLREKWIELGASDITIEHRTKVDFQWKQLPNDYAPQKIASREDGTVLAFFLNQLYFHGQGKYLPLKRIKNKFIESELDLFRKKNWDPEKDAPQLDYFDDLVNYGNVLSHTDKVILDAQPDPEGNLHLITRFALQDQPPGKALGQYGSKIFYQFLPAGMFDVTKNPDVKTVYLFTKTNCPNCEKVRNWLIKQGISYQENPAVLGGKEKQTIDSTLRTNQFPFLVIVDRKIDSREGTLYPVVYGLNPLSISSKMGREYGPEFLTLQTKSESGKILFNSGGNPEVLLFGDEAVSRWSLNEGQWNKDASTSLAFPTVSPEIISSPISGNTGSLGSYLVSNKQTVLSFAKAAGRIRLDQLSLVLFNGGRSEVGEWKLNNKNVKSVKVIKNAYDLYSFDTSVSLDPEPTAGAVLSELVPLQTIDLLIPFSSETAPELSLSSTSDLVSIQAVKGEDPGTWLARLSVDAGAKKPGEIAQSDSLTGTIKVTAGGQRIDLPFEIKPVAESTGGLAYAAPNTLTFYTAKDNSVTKKQFLINNYPRALTFSCGNVFSQKVPANSIVTIDIKPVSTSSSCVLNLDGAPTRQKLIFERKKLSGDLFWAEQDVLAPTTTVENRPINYKDCANGYCNCEQTRQAIKSAWESFASHVATINGQAGEDTIQQKYPNGYSENFLTRTGTLYDLDDQRLGSCPVNLAGFETELKPGSTYQLGFMVPQFEGWLSIDDAVPKPAAELLPQWTYATTGPTLTGTPFAADEEQFISLIEVS
ncbi:hypothetical protein HY994_05610 [Candidatus Micrarchaeota archaeon]|nr:hypothetical protein [Candidatus Micrarchaeota archaeon]